MSRPGSGRSHGGWASDVGATALVFVADLIPVDVPPTAIRWIEGDAGHHLARVRRLAVDEIVVLADGNGNWVESVVVEVGEGTVGVRTTGPPVAEPTPQPHLTVAFAPAKVDHGAAVTHQLVELGVDRIVPLATERSVVRWTGDRAEKQAARLRRVAREAAAQSHRARIPQVVDPVPISSLRAAVGEAAFLVGDRTGSSHGPSADAWCAVIGPEGGLGPTDWVALGPEVHRLAVGPHVLRAVTAPVAIAAVLASHRAG